MGYAVASLAWNTDLYSGVYGIWLLCILALCFWLGSTLQSLRQIYIGLAIGGAVSSVIGVLQAFGYPLVPVSQYPAGIYFNSMAQGGVLALLIVALLTERMYFYVVPLIPGLVVAQSRGAWLALMIGVAALFVRRTWILTPLVMLGAVAIFFPPNYTDTVRLQIWSIAWSELSFFGNGIGSFASQIYNDNGIVLYPEFVHNDILQLAYEFGIAALLPTAIFAFALSRTKEQEWPVLMAFVTMGFYSFPLWMPVTAFVGLLVTGRIVRSWHMDGRFSEYCRQVSLSRRRTDSRQLVSVVSTNTGSG